MKTQLTGQQYQNAPFLACTFPTADYGRSAITPRAQSNFQQIHRKKEALFE